MLIAWTQLNVIFIHNIIDERNKVVTKHLYDIVLNSYELTKPDAFYNKP